MEMPRNQDMNKSDHRCCYFPQGGARLAHHDGSTWGLAGREGLEDKRLEVLREKSELAAFTTRPPPAVNWISLLKQGAFL